MTRTSSSKASERPIPCTTSSFSPPVPPPFTDTIPTPQVLAQGAEGILFKSYFLTPDKPCAIKYRPVKTWRHPTLDQRLTRHRILSEARILVRCRRDGISVPGVLALDWEGASLPPGSEDGLPASATAHEVIAGAASAPITARLKRAGGWMITEWIDGATIRHSLDTWLPRHKNVAIEPIEATKVKIERPEEVKDLMRRVGSLIGRMHRSGVIHGDLTTSNLMLKSGSGHEADAQGQQGGSPVETKREEKIMPSLDGDVVLIDFGLATQSIQDEDRAVDLYVLERAFGSTHPDTEDLFSEVLGAYSKAFPGARAVLKRLDEVRLRGRKKSMIG